MPKVTKNNNPKKKGSMKLAVPVATISTRGNCPPELAGVAQSMIADMHKKCSLDGPRVAKVADLGTVMCMSPSEMRNARIFCSFCGSGITMGTASKHTNPKYTSGYCSVLLERDNEGKEEEKDLEAEEILVEDMAQLDGGGKKVSGEEEGDDDDAEEDGVDDEKKGESGEKVRIVMCFGVINCLYVVH